MLTTLAAAAGAIFTLAGNGTTAPIHDGALATRAGLGLDQPIAAQADGGVLIGDNTRIWRVDPQGRIHAVAGTGRPGRTGDGGPALRARIAVTGLAALPGGGLLFTDSDRGLVRMVGPDGVIATVAGGGFNEAEGVPARKAILHDPGALAALPGGGFLVADNGVRVREVGPDGRIRTVAGNGADDTDPPALHGQPATSVTIDAVDVAAAPDGGFLIADWRGGRVERVAPDGAITVAADDPRVLPLRVAATADGGLLVAADRPSRLWRATPDGTLTRLGGGGPLIPTAPLGLEQRLDGESALGARLTYLVDVDVASDGGALVSSGERDIVGAGQLVRYIAPRSPVVLGAALLRDRDRVLRRHAAVSVALTRAATVRLTLARRSVVASLPAGVTRAALPAVPADRPWLLRLSARSPDGRRAFDELRLYPPHWLPAVTARLVAEHVLGGGFAGCRRLTPARVDCRKLSIDARCTAAAVAFRGGRLLWAAHPCGERRARLRPLRRRDWSCDRLCRPDLFGRLTEAALVPSR